MAVSSEITTQVFIRKFWYVGLRKHNWIKMSYNKLQTEITLSIPLLLIEAPTFIAVS